MTEHARPGPDSPSRLTARHVELLRSVDLFKRLDRVALARLAGCVEAVPVASGQVVCRQGETGEALYIVTDGVFGAYYLSPTDGDEHQVGQFVRGGFFGEM